MYSVKGDEINQKLSTYLVVQGPQNIHWWIRRLDELGVSLPTIKLIAQNDDSPSTRRETDYPS